MDNFYLSAVAREIGQDIAGRTVARVFLSNAEIIFDLRLESGQALVASLDPASPAFYLSRKNLRSLDSDVSSTHPFSLQLRKRIEGGKILSLLKSPLDRLLRLEFEKYDASGDRVRSSLILALTGRASNAFLFDSGARPVAALTDRTSPPEFPWNQGSSSPADSISEDGSLTELEILQSKFGSSSVFSPLLKNEFVARCSALSPPEAFRSLIDDLQSDDLAPLVYSRIPLEEIPLRVVNLKTDLLLSQIKLTQAQGMIRNEFSTLSQAADAYYSARGQQKALQARFASARQFIAQEIKKRQAAMTALARDRERFEDPERLKRSGDLLLANLSTAIVRGTRARVIDFYDPAQTEIEIEVEEGKPLQQSASAYFARYQKARRALGAIDAREKEVAKHLPALKTIFERLEANPTAQQIAEARAGAEKEIGLKPQSASRSSNKAKSNAGGRRFKTSDGYEVLVGRNDRENDALTFRESKPLDIWLHTADYPGSHVIIRNPRRETVPQKSIIEAAELAAFYSQVKREGKAAVHYTQKKFVTKPPRAKPGLVRLSSFKTILVEPRCGLDRWE